MRHALHSVSGSERYEAGHCRKSARRSARAVERVRIPRESHLQQEGARRSTARCYGAGSNHVNQKFGIIHLHRSMPCDGGAAMLTNGQTEARKLRARLNHPIIDADGHWAEFAPHMREEFRRIGGDTAVQALDMASARIPNSLRMSVSERRRRRIGQEAFWFLPTKNTLDRATAMMPRLLYERLDDLGLDFCVIYPTAGLGYYRLPPEKLRRALCRAYNIFTAEQFRPYGDRIIPAAIIPMYSPEEAIEELEFVSKQLGLRVVMMGSLIRRPVPALVEEHPEAAKFVEWYDPIAIDSEHDYEPVWQKLRELRIAPSFHNGARSILLRNSPSNFCYNHIGHFASASEAMAKAIFFGGVTRRFPELNFAFLEGGAGWACSLYADLIGHWEKRKRDALENTNPARLDRAGLLALAEHGLLDDNDFRDFMFANAVRFWGEVNPDFFKGTVVEKQAAEVLARPR